MHERVIDWRRLVLLDALLHDDAARRFSDTATLCFHELYAVLFRAELLVPMSPPFVVHGHFYALRGSKRTFSRRLLSQHH